MDWLKKIPVLGSLAGEGLKSSEGVGFAGLIAWATLGTMTLEKAIAVAGLGIGLGIYALARSNVKEVHAKV
jgi:hypothetical protein